MSKDFVLIVNTARMAPGIGASAAHEVYFYATEDDAVKAAMEYGKHSPVVLALATARYKPMHTAVRTDVVR